MIQEFLLGVKKLSTEESYYDDYFNAVVNSGEFGFAEGWYGNENKWNTFNEFFARELISQDVRPIADASLVSPADSNPQGVWKIDDDGNIIQKEGVVIKSKQYNKIADLIRPNNNYKDSFKDKTLTLTFFKC